MSTRPLSIVAVGDAHYPWANRDCIKMSIARIKELKPDVVVQIGDLYDFYNLSSFAKSLNILTPEEEFRRGRAQAEDFWTRVRLSSRKSRLFQLLGNHEGRAMKRLMERAPALESFVDLKTQFQFEGVETQRHENEEIVLPDGTVLMHGFLPHGKHVRHNLANTIRGHLHQGDVDFLKLRDRIVWELDCGTTADLKAPVFDYRAQKTLSGWTNGLGVVDEHGPRFEPWGG